MNKITINKSGNYTYFLDQEGQTLDIRGRFKLNGVEKLTIQLTVIHQAKNTKAHISIKATVADHAKASIVGTVIVNESATQTESFLEERILLLSEHATAEAIPNLEIKTNEVKCSHAATVAQFDDEQLFYLTSRGIPESASKVMLAEAFLVD